MLWIALHLPLLSLESFAATLAPELCAQPVALLDAHRIVSANASARALGVKPGLKCATALALAPQLTLGLADAARDAQALTAVAHAELAFTPGVSIEPARGGTSSNAVTPDTLLLDVQASLRYFGGSPALLAHVHPQLHCADLAAPRRAFDAAPVWLIGPGRDHWEALQGMGLRTIADLRALPRARLARRFGEALLSELDRAIGNRPDPREPIRLTSTFDSRRDLFARADTTEQLLYGAAVLLARVVAWLAAQHAFVRRFSLVVEHERHRRTDAQSPATTTLDIALAEPSRESDLLVLLRERLQARLGPAQVLRLETMADHRPERASRMCAAEARMRPARARATQATPDSSIDAAVRPTWLLAHTEPLAERQTGPTLAGQSLQLLSGPERIESGWWDAALAERDYFIAQLPGGALVWIYRARLPVEGAMHG